MKIGENKYKEFINSERVEFLNMSVKSLIKKSFYKYFKLALNLNGLNMRNSIWTLQLGMIILFISCSNDGIHKNDSNQPIYIDRPYIQDYAIKYNFINTNVSPKKVYTDRNGVVQILASNQLYRPNNGHFQYPGTIVPDIRFRPMADKSITDMIIYENQFVYLDENAVLSNAWAGKLYVKHQLPAAKILCAGSQFSFLISDGNNLIYLNDSKIIWEETLPNTRVLSIKYNKFGNEFLILTEKDLFSLATTKGFLQSLYMGVNLTCFETINEGKTIITRYIRWLF